MTDEQILELAKSCGYDDLHGRRFWVDQLLKFARAIIEEHEKDREYNLSEDAYFNSWRK
jgi:hypothetical protein